MNRKVTELVGKLDTRKCTNNTQKVLVRLLRADGDWVSRRAIQVPSASSRVRDLRTEEFGKFEVECATARELGREGDGRRTYYRLAPTSVTPERVERVLRGVVTTSK